VCVVVLNCGAFPGCVWVDLVGGGLAWWGPGGGGVGVF